MTALSRTCLLAAVWALTGPPCRALAADVTSPMLSPADLTSGAAAGTQGAIGTASGYLHYPDEILAFPVRETDENKDLIGSWSATHRFFVVPINVGIEVADGKTPESLSLTVTFPGVGALARQPIVVDCFPKTGFSPPTLTASAQLRLDGDLKFVPNPVASADAGAKLAMDYKFGSNYANVVSGNGSGTAFWQFTRTKESYPVGELPLKIVVAVPMQMVADGMSMTADVRITYSGRWWTTGTSVGSFRSHVSYPQ